MPFNRNKAEASLRKKGFKRHSGDHRYFHHYHNGKPTGAFFYTSHGGSKTINDTLLPSLKKELRLDTSKQVKDLLNCPMNEDAYWEILLKKDASLG